MYFIMYTHSLDTCYVHTVDSVGHTSVNRPRLFKLLALLYSINWLHNDFGPPGTRQTLIPTDLLAR